MAFGTAWKRLSPRQLNFAIQAFSLIAIFFEGYDQGVMGGVNASPRYVQEVAIGTPAGVVTNDVKQGGIVSIYYLGAIVGCFVGGWAADRIGRINGLFYAAFFALIGGALQAATQSADFILIARVVTGLGTGALVLLVGIKMLPDSPRFYASVGRLQEAKEVLVHIRGGLSPQVEQEFNEICVVAEESRPSSPVEFIKILLGMNRHKAPHLGRRAWLCIWLQIMASWTGITAVTAYSSFFCARLGTARSSKTVLLAV
ncbi:hypothetical protein LTR78_006910 [Recurvomyces mirabilis]|uniref:Major facilitator superfamily (MFS) profile domain-containing protein n=1 Tax=Recurvomyces mirabilis TaxID=574656 RepID=A0AAE0WKF8_9PEZI|nr:hypothetical protein LTR78_006910 [Recurvomyces mirabilis]